MNGLQDVSNELMNHFSFMLKYVVGLRNNSTAPLDPRLLLVTALQQTVLDAEGNAGVADEWFDQCIRENNPRYAIYVKDALYTGDNRQIQGEAFVFVMYDQMVDKRFIVAQPYVAATAGQPLQEVGTLVWIGLLSNEPLYTGNPALLRVTAPRDKPWWKFR
ncbi:hypothetical protein [Chitinophaga flava]|uniref:Uncharacterized protein n=1 Tax=Chitinophaga flava TaxID=2259036 RepID=A0A365XXJ9_9BACT|nr:hypothetical protein [Chitinophaga flava]RBL90434.1 hypothetical protein DF182_28655 [Chitinophaga flava]